VPSSRYGLAQNDLLSQRRQSKYIGGGGRSRRRKGYVHWGKGLQNFFLILDLKMAICGAFLVQFFAVQLKL